MFFFFFFFLFFFFFFLIIFIIIILYILGKYCLHLDCLKNDEGHTCSAHGVCNDGVCLCEPGRYGDVCEKQNCPSTPVDLPSIPTKNKVREKKNCFNFEKKRVNNLIIDCNYCWNGCFFFICWFRFLNDFGRGILF